MYICLCNAMTEEDLKKMVEENPNLTMDDLRAQGIADNCYKCSFETEKLLLKHIAEKEREEYNKQGLIHPLEGVHWEIDWGLK